jgi:hypothetical protein
VTVTTAATKLISNIRGGGLVKADADMYIGGDDVTTANGWLLSAGDVYSLDLAGDDALYAVTASGTATASVVTNRGV